MPIEPQPCALPYGLSWPELGSALPDFAAGNASWISYEKRGLHREENSRILTVSYATQNGSTRTATVFIKRTNAEAAKYRFLADRRVPTPRLLQALVRDDAEILVLEFLPIIGISPDGADELLRLLAGLNAVEDPPRPLFQPPPGMPAAAFNGLVTAALNELAADPRTPVDPARWLRAYKSAGEIVATLPTALNHGEMYFQQIGWSAGQRRLVLFDLESLALRPIFTDIAGMLAGLAALTGRSERELFATYLAMLPGSAWPESEAWETMRMVRVVRSFQSLPWLANNPQIGDRSVRTLADDLVALDLLD